MKGLIGLGAALAALTVAPAAQAMEADLSAPTSLCRVAEVDRTQVAKVCFSVDAGLSNTTVAPRVQASFCTGKTCGVTTPLGVNMTGYEKGGRVVLPEVDPATGSVSWAGGTLGYVWLNGARTAVRVPGFCVGDPGYCGSLLVIV
jgi:hypothetical protein